MERESTTCVGSVGRTREQRASSSCSASHLCVDEVKSTTGCVSPQGQSGKKRVSSGPGASSPETMNTIIIGKAVNEKTLVEGTGISFGSGTESSLSIPVGETPYPHQVGGHGALSRFKNGYVLKPASKREIEFYTFVYSDRLPQSLEWLRQMTPKFFGVCENSKKEEEKAVKTQVASYVDSKSESNAMVTEEYDRGNKTITEGRTIWKDQAGNLAVDISPWARACLLKKEPIYNNTNSFIILEDLTSNFQKPCVLDCKMGTRHYDDDASEEKKRAHILKALSTTSSSMGIRFTGMQVYKLPYRNFLFHDKYYGRCLQPAQLKDELYEFFHNGVSLRIDIMEPFISRLKWLYQRMESEPNFNFYSSSLLFVYEGEQDDKQDTIRADVRMIDFAHTQWYVDKRNDGYLFGLTNLIELLESLLQGEP
eukprot:jgi/Galph1/1918/GphlegSOOS_G590.1